MMGLILIKIAALKVARCALKIAWRSILLINCLVAKILLCDHYDKFPRWFRIWYFDSFVPAWREWVWLTRDRLANVYNRACDRINELVDEWNSIVLS